MKVAIIPARGGSKRIPKKNIRNFCGLPMIAWSIRAAKKADIFNHIIVSTDDNEIADIAKKEGAEVPFKRPKILSNDHTVTLPVILHAIEKLEKKIGNLSAVCCIYATAPFINEIDLRKSYNQLKCTKADFVFPVTTFPFPIQRAIKLKDDRMEMFSPQYLQTRSQDLEEAFHDAGQFYWGWRDAWVSQKDVIGHNASPYIVPRKKVQDIDTEEDWEYAELLFRIINKQENNI